MDCTEDEETPQQSQLPRDILCLPARKVIPYRKIRDPLSLQLNIVGALKNWKDVADLLGYSAERILGYFAHQSRPGLLLLEDWIYKRNGILEKLVNVLSELEFYACLDVIRECVEEYQRTLATGSRPREEDDDDDDGIGDLRGNQLERYEHDLNAATCSLSSDITEGSVIVSSVNCSYSEQTTSMTSEYSTTSSLPVSVLVNSEGNNFDRKMVDLGSKSTKCDEELQEKSFSSDNLSSRDTKEGATAARPELFRYSSWSPLGTEAHLENPDLLRVNQDGRSYIRSNSHEPNSKTKDGKKSFRKRLVKIFSKTKRHKRSPELSGNEGNPSLSVSSGESSLDMSMATSFTVTGSYNEEAQNPKENLSPLKVTEARRLSNSDSLSSGESVASPTSPGYESGYMSSPEAPLSSGKTISIIHCFHLEGKDFQEEVLKLYSHFSRDLGYKCHLDKLEIVKVAENKFRYAMKSVQESDFVFICVSPELRRIFDLSPEEISDSLEDDEACMVRLESDLILADVSINASNRKGKYMTILLKGSSKSDVPCFLNLFMKYQWPSDERKIRCMIEGQPEIVPAPVCSVKTDPPSTVVKPAKLH